MVTITNENFSISKICKSGQCFRMNEMEDGRTVSLIAHGRYMEVTQDENTICFDCSQEEYDSIWKNYFDMETDYAEIMSCIDTKDHYLVSAVEYGKGIRILNQDLWEMIISFIVSQQNNIKRIRKCIGLLCERYGEKKVAANGIEYYDFPTPRALAGAAIEDLYACNLGYRSRYIHETANSILRGDIDLDQLYQMDYDAAKAELLKLCGIGVKVADCICLFALHKTDAFPKDTHINKVLATQYQEGFPFEKYVNYSGILQQYIFYYDLNGMA